MFGLFRKKEPSVVVKDKIWMTTQAKWQACAQMYRQQQQTLFVSWFEESRNSLDHFLKEQGIGDAHMSLAGSVYSNHQPVVFVEHFPLPEEEQRKFLDLGLVEAVVFSALDEPLFRAFGGENLIQLMQKMGMKEDEEIEHKMISASVKRAQEKIGKKAVLITAARSQADWLQNAGILKTF